MHPLLPTDPASWMVCCATKRSARSAASARRRGEGSRCATEGLRGGRGRGSSRAGSTAARAVPRTCAAAARRVLRAHPRRTGEPALCSLSLRIDKRWLRNVVAKAACGARRHAERRAARTGGGFQTRRKTILSWHTYPITLLQLLGLRLRRSQRSISLAVPGLRWSRI